MNLPEGKNLVGAFHQPVVVVSDVANLHQAGITRAAGDALTERGYSLLLASTGIVTDAQSSLRRGSPDRVSPAIA